MTREQARNLLRNSKPKGNNAHYLMLNEALDMAIEALEQEHCDDAVRKSSQPKTGHWIDYCGGVKCSCCGYCIDDCYYVRTYCPNCGVKMKKSEDKE